MNTSKFILAITSAVLGAGLMLVFSDLTSSPAIEGWTPINNAVASTLVEQQQSQLEQQPQSDPQSKQEIPNNKDNQEQQGKLTPSSEIKQEQNQQTTKRVNINTAGLVELQNIPGVGEKKAQTIIDYRNKHGAFKKVQDLTKVKGIGTKSFQKMKPFIEIGS